MNPGTMPVQRSNQFDQLFGVDGWVNQSTPNASPMEMLYTTQDAAEAAARRQRNAVIPHYGRQEGAATAAPENALKQLLTLPARAGQAAVQYGETGEYDAAPIMESALTAMTGGMPFAQAGALGSAGGKIRQGALASVLPMPKTVNSFDDVRRALDQNERVFVRWTQSQKHDMTPGARSKDYQSGQEHAGLSAVPIDRDFSDDQIFRFIRDYGYLRSAGNERAVPRIYSGKIVGKDSDGAVSIVPKEHIGTLSDDFVRFIDDETNLQRMSLSQDIAQGRAALSYYEKNPPSPNDILIWTPGRVAEMEAKLKALGGPVKLPGTK
jgi:hypothetical protein